MTALLYLFFFASGLSALIYQVAWVRILAVSFGNTVYAISTVLTVFMGGLALGSYLFGRWIDRGWHPLRVYGALELLLGAYAVLFLGIVPHLPQLAVWLLGGQVLPHTPTSLLKFMLAAALLLAPTTLMGGTLPVLAKHVVDSPQRIGRRLGALYGFNTLGAVFGCLLEAYLLILLLGINGSILLAAVINGLLALGSIALSFYVKRGHDEAVLAGGRDEPTCEAPRTPNRVEPRLRLLHAIAFSSGLITLATEVLWTRLLINFLSGNVLIFATVLGGFLAGIALGSFLVARWVDHLRRLDFALGTVLAISALCLAGSVAAQRSLGDFFHYVRGLDSVYSPSATVYLCLTTLFVVVTVPATVFGAVFPLLFRWCSRSLSSLGHDVGRLYASNTIGSIAGSFVSGFVLISLFGVNSSLALLAAGYAGLSLLVYRTRRHRLIAMIPIAACLTLAVAPGLRRPIFWFNAGFNTVARISEEATVLLDEGVEATVGVADFGDTLVLTVNGVTVAETTFQDLWDLLLKAHLPMLLHENPKRVALVGLGAGVSAGAVAAYDVDRIDCIEIAPAVVRAHRLFEAFNSRCWKDPRLKLWVNDGRHFLLTTKQRYDVISVDPTDPPICDLYTQDFFQLCHDRLDDGGLMVQWVPLFHLRPQYVRVIMRAFLNAFEQTTLWYDGTSVLLVGRRGGPLEVNLEQFVKRLAQPRVKRSLSLINRPHQWLLLATYVCGPDELKHMIGPDIPENSDNLPYLEYAILRSGRLDARTTAANVEMLLPHYQPNDDYLRAADQKREDIARLRTVREAMRDLMQVRIHVRRREKRQAEELIDRFRDKYKISEKQWRLLQPFIG